MRSLRDSPKQKILTNFIDTRTLLFSSHGPRLTKDLMHIIIKEKDKVKIKSNYTYVQSLQEVILKERLKRLTENDNLSKDFLNILDSEFLVIKVLTQDLPSNYIRKAILMNNQNLSNATILK